MVPFQIDGRVIVEESRLFPLLLLARSFFMSSSAQPQRNNNTLRNNRLFLSMIQASDLDHGEDAATDNLVRLEEQQSTDDNNNYRRQGQFSGSFRSRRLQLQQQQQQPLNRIRRLSLAIPNPNAALSSEGTVKEETVPTEKLQSLTRRVMNVQKHASSPSLFLEEDTLTRNRTATIEFPSSQSQRKQQQQQQFRQGHQKTPSAAHEMLQLMNEAVQEGPDNTTSPNQGGPRDRHGGRWWSNC